MFFYKGVMGRISELKSARKAIDGSVIMMFFTLQWRGNPYDTIT